MKVDYLFPVLVSENENSEVLFANFASGDFYRLSGEPIAKELALKVIKQLQDKRKPSNSVPADLIQDIMLKKNEFGKQSINHE